MGANEKKAAALHGSERDDYTPTPAQVTMRHEMTAGQAIDEAVGGLAAWNFQAIALDIIQEYDLALSLKQWQIVQNMVEDGIRAGLVRRGERAPR